MAVHDLWGKAHQEPRRTDEPRCSTPLGQEVLKLLQGQIGITDDQIIQQLAKPHTHMVHVAEQAYSQEHTRKVISDLRKVMK